MTPCPLFSALSVTVADRRRHRRRCPPFLFPRTHRALSPLFRLPTSPASSFLSTDVLPSPAPAPSVRFSLNHHHRCPTSLGRSLAIADHHLSPRPITAGFPPHISCLLLPLLVANTAAPPSSCLCRCSHSPSPPLFSPLRPSFFLHEPRRRRLPPSTPPPPLLPPSTSSVVPKKSCHLHLPSSLLRSLLLSLPQTSTAPLLRPPSLVADYPLQARRRSSFPNRAVHRRCCRRPLPLFHR